MASADTTTLRTVAIPANVRHFKLSLWTDSRETYEALVAENLAEEHSARTGERWHRWATWQIDENDYSVHDPERYDTDPLNGEKRLADLMDMMARVVHADDMGATEKVRELSRLSARMRKIAPATYADGTTDASTEAIDVIADALMPLEETGA